MINLGKTDVLGVDVSAVDYDYSVNEVITRAKTNRPLSVTALAVHGLVLGINNQEFRRRLNGIDMVLPDGQPVYWLLKFWKKKDLPSRVYGPEFMLRVIKAAEVQGIGVYLYGSTINVLDSLIRNLKRDFPGLKIAGSEPSRFRKISKQEQQEIIERIKRSQAGIVFVGLGCPRQEYWVFEYSRYLNKPLIAVGAAFNYHAGLLKKPPAWLQNLGLEWLFRLFQEPKRLTVRYVLYNTEFLILFIFNFFRLMEIKRVYPSGCEKEELYG